MMEILKCNNSFFCTFIFKRTFFFECKFYIITVVQGYTNQFAHFRVIFVLLENAKCATKYFSMNIYTGNSHLRRPDCRVVQKPDNIAGGLVFDSQLRHVQNVYFLYRKTDVFLKFWALNIPTL